MLAIDRGLRRELIKVEEGEEHIDLRPCILLGAEPSNIRLEPVACGRRAVDVSLSSRIVIITNEPILWTTALDVILS